MSKRRKFICLDCPLDTGKALEHYFVQTPLWLSVVKTTKGMLCVGCLEQRLGRALNRLDFTLCSINDPKKASMSDRLRQRIMSAP